MRAKKNYYVYIMANKGRVLYVGVTGFFMSRVLQHKSAEVDGFTKRYHVTRLVYYEVFHNVNNAIARETEIKKWRREKKVARIRSYKSNCVNGHEKRRMTHGYRQDADRSTAEGL